MIKLLFMIVKKERKYIEALSYIDNYNLAKASKHVYDMSVIVFRFNCCLYNYVTK